MPTLRSVQTRSAQQRRQGLPRFVRNRTQKFPQALLPILEDPFDIAPLRSSQWRYSRHRHRGAAELKSTQVGGGLATLLDSGCIQDSQLPIEPPFAATEMSMNILVTGATGFIGAALVSSLAEAGHHTIRLRREPRGRDVGPTWNPETGQIHLDDALPLDAVVHLAGENIAQRWTRAAKARIRSSRVDATRLLSEAVARLPQPPRVMVCASATGFYGDRADELLDERSQPGNGFLAEICRAWEAAADPARQSGIRVVNLRLGIVLAKHGGALAKMLPIFRLGLGGRLGSGGQYLSWIALDDLMRVVELALLDNRINGPFNAVSPQSPTNKEFTSSLSRALHRPAFLPVPALFVQALFGEMGREALLASARVQPARLLEMGFSFLYPELNAALRHLLAAGPQNQIQEIRNRLSAP